MIDIGAHCAGAARTPRPNGGADIIDDRQLRQHPPHATRNPMGEIRRVDDDETIGRGLDHSSRCRIDVRNKLRQARQHWEQAHHRNIGEWKKARETFSRHCFAADAQKGYCRLRGPQRSHQERSKLIA